MFHIPIGCGTNHQVNFGDSVTIASPNYPEVYGDNLECLYYIEVRSWIIFLDDAITKIF